jgi:hypothetical protein
MKRLFAWQVDHDVPHELSEKAHLPCCYNIPHRGNRKISSLLGFSNVVLSDLEKEIDLSLGSSVVAE